MNSPQHRISLRERLSGGSVEWSPDFARVLSLPRRPKPELAPIIQELTAKLKRPEGTMTLRPIQALALHEAVQAGGLIGMVRIGGGKTLISMLMPMVMPGCQRSVLLIPSDLRDQFYKDWKEYGQHWKLPNLAGEGPFVVGRPVLHLMTYSELSHKKGTDALIRINPDHVGSDECQALRNVLSARGGRFFDFFPARPKVRFTALSASITANSFTDMTHLFVVALGPGAPVPVAPSVVKEWASALDPDVDIPFDSGVLRMFCLPEEDVRDGVHRRLVDTLGVIASTGDQIDIPLTFIERKPPPMPADVLEAYRKLKRKNPETDCWTRPDGEPLEDQLEVQDCARDLAVGLYLRTIFPRGEAKELIDLWYEIRSAWNRELRTQLQGQRSAFFDSPALLEEAAARYYEGGCPECNRTALADHSVGCKIAFALPVWNSYAYPAWKEIREAVYTESETVWMSDWMVQDMAQWAREHVGIIWVEHPKLGERLAEVTGCRYYGSGDEAHAEIGNEKGDRTIICSIASHHKGKNLQAFNKNLIAQWPSSAELVEQTVGRSHRDGQTKPVSCWYYAHTVELENSVEKSVARAKWMQSQMGPQKICYAIWQETTA